MSERIGEVVETSSTRFTTQCYRLYDAPPLGSLLRAGSDRSIYGVVFDVATRSMDPARHPIPRGEAEEVEEDVYLANPQLSRLLLTEVRSIVAGYREDGRTHRRLAPLPPRVYSFVYGCDAEEIRDFTESLEFLPSLLGVSAAEPPDDVIAAFLHLASATHPAPEQFMLEAGRELAALLGGQLQRLNLLLRRLSP